MSVNATDAAETIINFTGISLYQLLAGVAGIAATATGILAWRLSALTTRVNDMKETIDKLGEIYGTIEAGRSPSYSSEFLRRTQEIYG